MGLDSLFIGVTGLEAYQNQIDVVSNNIANVGTTGYKGQDVNFEDLLYQAQSFATAPSARQTAASTVRISASASRSVRSIPTCRKVVSKRPASTPTSRWTATASLS